MSLLHEFYILSLLLCLQLNKASAAANKKTYTSKQERPQSGGQLKRYFTKSGKKMITVSKIKRRQNRCTQMNADTFRPGDRPFRLSEMIT